MNTVRAEVAAAREQQRRRAWIWRILECVVVTLIMTAVVAALLFLDFGSLLQAVAGFAIFAVSIMVAIYWTSATGRLLRGGVFHLTGFFIAVFLLAGAAGGGAGSLLALDGRTATCATVRVEQIGADMFGNDWEHVLRCPDGTVLEIKRKEEDDAALRGPLVYQPAGLVQPKPLAVYEGTDATVLRWAFLVTSAAFLLQFAAAITSGLIRRSVTKQHPDDND
ncbi:hypothetical protein [Actinoplanes sp. NPDC023714]|uniref:hypothetical protein n=1 Tax=Actinoplanes sp. NPDC023714 TaxID=3154322 RepID=UPI003410BC97